MDTGYRTDKELKTILDQTGIDSEEYFRIMDNYDKGKTDIMADVAGGTVAKSEKLKSAIDALADKRRILKEGLKPSDIPEGATNRDVIKKVFFNEIDNFGEEVDPSNFQQSDQIQTVVNADLDKLATSDQKKDQDALSFLNQFELDAPADASVINSGLNILSGKPARASRQESRSGIMGQGQYVEGVGYVT